eukprot:3404542-Ditylum_brightwellii.AAC.1
MVVIKVPSLEDIKAGFVNDPLDKIMGLPTYNDIDKLQKQCMQNATMLESTLGGGANGLAGLVELPGVYLMRTGHNFLRPLNPDDAPPYQAGQSPVQQE